jgi:hypothetical protein
VQFRDKCGDITGPLALRSLSSGCANEGAETHGIRWYTMMPANMVATLRLP